MKNISQLGFMRCFLMIRLSYVFWGRRPLRQCAFCTHHSGGSMILTGLITVDIIILRTWSKDVGQGTSL